MGTDLAEPLVYVIGRGKLWVTCTLPGTRGFLEYLEQFESIEIGPSRFFAVHITFARVIRMPPIYTQTASEATASSTYR